MEKNLSQNNLKLDWCSYQAAKYACEHWHYSKSMPAGKLVKIGVWENQRYIGCVIFGRGANNNAHKYFKVKMTECCELVRIALDSHITPVTKMMSIAIKMLKKLSPNLKLIFSYADETNQHHKGIIYKAGNWEYLGTRTTGKDAYYIINGVKIHGRSARAKYKNKKHFPIGCEDVGPQTKHLFVYNLCVSSSKVER